MTWQVSIKSHSRLCGEASRSWHTGAQEVTVEPFAWIDMNIPTLKGSTQRTLSRGKKLSLVCESVGKRLCSSAEWELACRGTEGRMYSYGQHRNRNTCNTQLKDLVHKDGMFLHQIGEKEDCKTPEGVYDLNGSLSEWVLILGVIFLNHLLEMWWSLLRTGERCEAVRCGTTLYGQDCTSRHGHRMKVEEYG